MPRMTDMLKPYPVYKDSGASWLGEVPEHWEVRRLKQVCRFTYGDSLPTDLRNPGDVPVFGSNGIVGTHLEGNTKAPCIVIGRKGSFGKVNFSFEPVFAIDTTYFIDDRNTNADLRWLYFLLGWLNLDTVSKDSAVPGLSREDAYQELLPLPPPLEQTAIVRFLDWADGRIQRVIRARERRIKLLEEYKQALINKAVTGQIDVRSGKPYLAYKDSGVEWLGEVPEHWEVRKLRQTALMLVSNVDKHTKEDEVTIRLCNYVDVYKNERITADVEFMQATASLDEITRFQLRYGDVVITKDSETWNDIGVPALVEHEAPDLLYGYHLAILRPYHNQLIGLYMLRAFQSQGVATQFHVVANGVTRFGLSHDAIKNVHIPVPPLSEQTAIVEFLDTETERIDTAITADHRVIDLLKEFRTRLIADVVTGKLDVRKAAAKLLDEPDNLELDKEIDTLKPDENADTFEPETPGIV